MSEQTELPMREEPEKKPGTCATCHHWHLRFGFGVHALDQMECTDEPWGHCERYPPVLTDPGDCLNEEAWQQPTTLYFIRCGEWKAKDGPPDAPTPS